jgi:hypothetical protein
VFY